MLVNKSAQVLSGEEDIVAVTFDRDGHAYQEVLRGASDLARRYRKLARDQREAEKVRRDAIDQAHRTLNEAQVAADRALRAAQDAHAQAMEQAKDQFQAALDAAADASKSASANIEGDRKAIDDDAFTQAREAIAERDAESADTE